MAFSRCLRGLAAMLSLAAPVAASRAAAADLPPPVMPVAAPVEAFTAESGWYLRGDLTLSDYGSPRDATRPDPNDPGMPPLVGLRLGHEAGYRFNDWLRIDATVDNRAPARFRAFSSRSNFVTGYNVEAGELDVLTGLVNVYADLGTWWGLTPYIGGGVGLADASFRRNYTQTTCLLDACDGTPGTGNRAAVARPNHAVTSFAWALTAGLSYRLTAGLSLDAAYRYVDLGVAKSGIDPYGGSTRLKDLTASEVRIGLRYSFAGGLLPVAAGNGYGN